MANVKSYAWGQRLSEAVPVGESVTVQTPGFEQPDNFNTDETQVVVTSTVLNKDQFEAAWAGDHASCEVTNNTEADWQPSDTIYVTVPGVPFDADHVEESFDALAAQVADHETRIAALETGAGGAAGGGGSTRTTITRVKHNEEPARHSAKPKKRGK